MAPCSCTGANDEIISVTWEGSQWSFAPYSVGDLCSGIISGAASMTADEYISIKSQQDIEKNALDMEARELKCHPEHELQKLKNIYIQRGLQPALAEEVTK